MGCLFLLKNPSVKNSSSVRNARDFTIFLHISYIGFFLLFSPLDYGLFLMCRKDYGAHHKVLSSGKNNSHLKQERFVKCSLLIKCAVEQKYTELFWEHITRSTEDLNMGIFVSL